MVRLSGVSGFLQSANNVLDQDEKIVRPAILVHAGSFHSQDGPIAFDENRLKTVVQNHNRTIDQLAKDYGGFEKVPVGAFPPILDQHEDDSNNRIIGRLASYLRFEKRDIPKVGQGVPCVCADVTFLGKDTVSRVLDGRIYHLSIGINEVDNTLGETSAVIQPAAPGAMLLSKKKLKGDKQMSKGLSKNQLNKLTKLKASFDETQKKIEMTKRSMKLTQKKGQINTRLGGLIKLGKLMPSEYRTLVANEGLNKLSKLDDESLSVALSVFEARENPVIMPGQIGSSNASDFSSIGRHLEDRQKFRLSSEIKKDFKKMSGGKVMFKGEDEQDETEMSYRPMNRHMSEDINPGKDEHVVPQNSDIKELAKHHLSKLGHHLSCMGKHLAEGNIEEAREEHTNAMGSHAHLAKVLHMDDGDEGDGDEGDGTPDSDFQMKHMAEYTGDVKSEDDRNNMNDLQSQIDELNTQLARMAGMLGELTKQEEEEGHDLESGIDSDKKPTEQIEAQPIAQKPSGEKSVA